MYKQWVLDSGGAIRGMAPSTDSGDGSRSIEVRFLTDFSSFQHLVTSFACVGRRRIEGSCRPQVFAAQ